MSSFICPFCNNVFAIDSNSYQTQRINFDLLGNKAYSKDGFDYQLHLYKCPNCGEFTFYAEGVGTKVVNDFIKIRPTSDAKNFPAYIPKAIREDYEEACAIINLSPKSSATLARRCLQGMIHDFWGIHEKTLNAEISALQPHVSASLWKVLDSIRKIGNIGAHMENDINLIVEIDPDEAQKLIKLIEYLIKEWYIERHEQEQLFDDIIGIAKDKEEKRKAK